MASLQIDLFDKTNDRRIWVMLRDNLPIKDLIHKLIQDLELPQGEYVLVDEESNAALPQESTLAEEGVKDQHALCIERKKKIVPIPIPIPIPAKKGKSAKPPKAEPGAETPAEKAPDEPPPEEEPPTPEEVPEQVKKAEPAPARKLPPTRPILPPLQRPIRRPPFLRRIPNQSWGCATPFNILLILFILMLFCFLGRLTCNIQFPLACFGKPDGAAVSPGGSAQTGCIRWNLLEEPETLDPLTFNEPLITNLLFMSLTDINPETLESVPALASSWEADESNTKWTFYLRNDISWVGEDQDGEFKEIRQVTSYDFIAMYAGLDSDALWDNEIGEYKTNNFVDVPLNHWAYDDSSINATAVGDLTIEFELSKPMNDFPRYISLIDGKLRPGEIDVQFVGESLSYGQYELGEWVREDHAVLNKNPYSPVADGIPDEIIFTWEDQDSALQKLKQRELDVVEIAHPIDFDETQVEFMSADGRFFLVDLDKKDDVIAAAGFAGLLFNVRPAQSWRASYPGDNPPSCDEGAFTYENPSSIEAYIQGDYDPDSKETITNPSFDDIDYALETGKIVRLFGEGWVEFNGSVVIRSINRVPNPDGTYNICLVDPETGEDQLAVLHNPSLTDETWDIYDWYWSDLTLDSMDNYATDEGTCYFGTVYIGINLDVAPFDQLEARQTLAGITDKDAYLQNMFGNNDDVTNSLIPHHFLGEYANQYEDVVYRFIPETASLVNASEQLSLAHCGDCEGSDRMAEGFTSLWENELGIAMKSSPISYDEYDGPIEGSSQALILNTTPHPHGWILPWMRLKRDSS